MRWAKIIACDLVLVSGLVLAAQDRMPSGRPRETSESLEPWEWFQELRLPARTEAGYHDFLIPPGIFDKARPDLADLRLRDARGREVPYALRVRRAQDEKRALPYATLSQGRAAADRSYVMTLDLGEGPLEHNEIEIVSEGSNFRRRVQLEGSNHPDRDWLTFLDKVELIHLEAGGQTIDVRRFNYPVSRFRYVRLQVFPSARVFDDRSASEDTPTIRAVTLFRTIQVPGLDVTLPASLGPREDVRTEGNPGSAWTIEFDGLTVPFQTLSFDVADESFVRPYRLERANPDEPREPLAWGEWRRRLSEERRPLEIRLPQESTARRLRLVLTDHRNQPLTLTGVRYIAPARQVIVEASEELAGPLRVYFGNPRAGPPHYDFARLLPDAPQPPPVRLEWLDPAPRKNPVYQPIPRPWTECWPWLVYVMLGVASVVLLGILAALGRQAIARHDREKAAV